MRPTPISLPVRRLTLADALFSGAFIFVSLLPRLLGLGRYITPDELVWVYRSVQFREALRAGQWAATLTTGHPGVITTWLASLGIDLHLLIHPADRAIYEWIANIAWYEPHNVTAFTWFANFLPAGRVAVAIVSSLGVGVIYILVRQLFGRSIALFCALLLALDPFVAGLSGLLHVDGLMTTFTMISLLALVLAITGRSHENGNGRLWYVALAGMMAALAVLTKSPAFLLLPFSALVLFLSLFQNSTLSLKKRFFKVFTEGVVWLGSFLIIVFLFFPALWVSPVQVVATIFGNAGRHIDTALRPTFFLGQMAYAHGPLFYPVTLPFRLGPLVLSGIFLTVFLIVLHKQFRRRWSWPALSIFLAWPLFFVAGITVAAKKFDRYALAAIPALTLVAAIAWIWILSRRARLARFVYPLLGIGQIVYLLSVAPYLLMAYNPLLGGIEVAQKVMTVGWGEGIGAAGHWLAGQPGAAGKTAVAGFPPSLAPFFPGRTLPSDPESEAQADYIIFTISGQQANPARMDELSAKYRLVHTVHFRDTPQAWIYQQANPQRKRIQWNDFSTPLSFDNQVQLLATAVEVSEKTVRFYVRWQLQRPSSNRYDVKLTLQDEAGHVWSQLETTLLNELYFYPEDWQEGETPQIRYELPLPPALPPGTYQVKLSLFESASQSQLPLLQAGGTFQGVAYTESGVGVPPPADPASARKPAIPISTTVSWLDGGLTLLGQGELLATVISGDSIVVDLYWQAAEPLPENLFLALALDGDPQTAVPLSRYATHRWRPGELIHEKYDLAIPPEWPAGDYQVMAMVLTADRVPLTPAVSLGSIEVIATDRLFTLPDGIPLSLDYRFEPGVSLRGLDLQTAVVPPGENIRLTLYWQTAIQPVALYNAFVHVLGPDGNIVTQQDPWPGGLPSNTWAPGQVIVDEYTIPLPPEASPGQYQLAVGLYTADNGVRLPVTTAAGATFPDNRIILPVTITVETADE